MFVLIDILLILFASVLMIGSFFVIERVRRLKYVVSLKLPKLAMELIVGFVYSGVFVLLQIIMESMSAGFKIQIFLMGFVALIIVSDYRVAAFSFPLALIYYVLLNHVNAAMYANIILFLVTSMIFIVIDVFMKGFKTRLITYSVGLVLSLVSLFVIAFPFGSGLNANTFRETMLGMLTLPILVEAISYSIRVSISANVLYESVNYDFGEFYRRSLKNTAIGRLIKSEKITQAFYGVLEIDFEKQLNDERDKEILESVLIEVQKCFPQETVLFKANDDSYGFFSPTTFKNELKTSILSNNWHKRDTSDPLHHLTKTLDLVSKRFKTTFGSFIDVEVFAGVALYGLQESSIEQLGKDAVFALKINKKNIDNRVTIFDPEMYRNKVNDSHHLQSLDKAVGLDDYVNRFSPIFNTDSSETAFNYVSQINTSETEFIDEVRAFISNTGMLDIFERYFAVDAISNVGQYHGDLMIDYSVGIFDSVFNIKEFIRQLNEYKFNPSRLILVAEDEEINSHADLMTIRLIVDTLKAEGIRFAVKGTQQVKLRMDYRLISTYDLNDNLPKFKETLVAFDLDTEESVEKAIEKGIKLIGGELFEMNEIPNNFNKQSRIYIEDIKSGKR